MKKNKKAITLIELLVGITIITIVILGSTNINFNRLNDWQKIKIYTNKILTNYEKIRNNSLFGKWIWVDLIIPDKWEINFSNYWSWVISTNYYSWALLILDNKIIFNDFYEISKIECLSLDETKSETFTWSNIWTWTIEIKWSNLTLTWSCNNPNYKKLITTIKYKNNFEEKIEINTVNWLIQIVK